MNDMIFIPTNTPSSKNSKQFLYRGGRGFLVNSKTTSAYIKSSAKDYENAKDLFKKMIEGLPKPYIIGVHFVRKTKQRWDFINICQVIFDSFVKHGILDDDNMNEMFPVPFQIDGRWYSVDKEKPGVYIKVFSGMMLVNSVGFISSIETNKAHKNTNSSTVLFGNTVIDSDFKYDTAQTNIKSKYYANKMTSEQYRNRFKNKKL